MKARLLLKRTEMTATWTLFVMTCLLFVVVIVGGSALDAGTCTSSSAEKPVCGDPEAVEKLLRYAVQLYGHGKEGGSVFSENVRVFCDEKKGRGLRVEGKRFKKNEIFLRLPLGALLTAQSLNNDKIEPANHIDALAMVLIEQDYLQHSYVATLPFTTGVITAFRMCEDDLVQRVKDPDLQEEARAMKDMVEERGRELQELNFIHDPVRYEKAVSIVQSRVFVINARKDGKWVRIPSMIMVADMMNLALPSKANADCITNEESTHFECYATRDIEDGEELLAVFVKKGDQDLDSYTWSYYGFAFSDEEKKTDGK